MAPNTERDKASKLHTALREGSKSFRYGFLFGMRAKRAGEILATIIRTARQVDPSYRAASTNGGEALRRFEAATPGLRQLRERLEIQAAQKGWVAGLDGRRVPTGAQYKALNRIVTSAEAIVCKRWLINVHDELRARFRYGWNGDCVLTLWIHDELVVCCRPELAEQVGEIMVRHAKEAGEHYQLTVPLDAGFQIGRSWAGENPNAEIPSDLSIPNFLLRCPAPPIAGTTTDEEVSADKPDDALAVHERTGRNSDARCDLGNSRRTIDPGISDGDGPHHQMHREDSARLAMASQVSGAPENGISTARDSNLGSASNGKIICPFHDDHDPSLQLYADGHYHCYVCGAHGDIEELPEAPPAFPPNAAQSQTDTLKRGIELWQAADSIRGTLGEQYLIETRKLDLAVLPDIDAVLRFHPRCPFDGNNHPCLVALFRDVETDEVAGIHRIALTASAEKIERMMLGSWPSPRAIKLRAGNDHLIAGEGIETVIAGAMRRADKSSTLWAMGSAGAIGKLPLVFDFTSLTVLVDREASNIGLDNARACTERWRRAGRKTGLAVPHQIKADFNDLIKGQTP